MDDILKEVYITMLSKHINWGTESRIFEAQWILTDLGIPMTIEIANNGEWTQWVKWTEE